MIRSRAFYYGMSLTDFYEMLNMMSSKGRTFKPEDLFTFDDEYTRPKIAPDSPEAEAVFKKMEEKFRQRWQSRLET